MNLYLKNIALPLCIILVVMMYDCKKDNAKNKISLPDFRDSIVGNYNCIEHYATHQFMHDSTGIHDIYSDTILSAIMVTVSKLASNDSSILVDGSTIFNILPRNTTNQTLNFFSMDTNWGVPDDFYFTTSNDSIWFQQYTLVQQYHQAYYYWTGRKQ